MLTVNLPVDRSASAASTGSAGFSSTSVVSFASSLDSVGFSIGCSATSSVSRPTMTVSTIGTTTIGTRPVSVGWTLSLEDSAGAGWVSLVGFISPPLLPLLAAICKSSSSGTAGKTLLAWRLTAACAFSRDSNADLFIDRMRSVAMESGLMSPSSPRAAISASQHICVEMLSSLASLVLPSAESTFSRPKPHKFVVIPSQYFTAVLEIISKKDGGSSPAMGLGAASLVVATTLVGRSAGRF